MKPGVNMIAVEASKPSSPLSMAAVEAFEVGGTLALFNAY
jgi:hypothetical protein